MIKTMLPLQGTQVQLLAGELRSGTLHSMSQKNKEREKGKGIHFPKMSMS